ncbi:hypothetical protein KF707_10020 [Candidatus Obscuribacterales bacterium]|jgi:predicted tellurium resistance membrane protein TerC|nr:hypothetical protein [Candidatus Obscuribacterales bacterium]MBX3136563.1 hypothetical protein [Candidatus Obscuribacterales bacterium]MBX3151045.1 hypothetical protein [Candidatus Obscuribacterales bacterium]
MPGTAIGIFIIDFIARPFARIFEKWPDVMMLILLFVYAIIGYIVWKSAFKGDSEPRRTSY